MNAAKFTLTSTILAAAFSLALGLAAAPAMADMPVCPGHDHGCGGDEPETSFEVSLTGLDNFGPEWGTETDCIGTTNPPQLGAQFDEAGPICSVTMDGGLVLNLFSITVRVRGNGMTDMMLYFTSGTVFIPPESDTVYATERLGTLVVLGELPAFELRLNAEDEDLTKVHQPDKGDVVGSISVGSFFYDEPID